MTVTCHIRGSINLGFKEEKTNQKPLVGSNCTFHRERNNHVYTKQSMIPRTTYVEVCLRTVITRNTPNNIRLVTFEQVKEMQRSSHKKAEKTASFL